MITFQRALRDLRAFFARRAVIVTGALMALDPKWGKRNDGPPDLDELLRNFKRKLAGWLGKRGGSNGSGGSFGDNAGGIGGGAVIVVMILLGIWLASGFYKVDAKQRAIVLRFGKFAEETQPGLRWHFPYPVETAEIVDVSQVRSVEVGFRGSAKVPREALMLTDDENIVDVQFAVLYVLSDPRAYLFNNRFAEDDASDAVLQAAETAVREVVGRSTMDFVINEGRAKVTGDAQKVMQQILDRYQTGIIISKVTMQNAQPPEQVQAAFADVVKAEQDRKRQINEGEAYANDVIPRARGAAARLSEEADGYNQRVTERAEGDASRFRQIAVEYSKAPAVTRERLYLEAMEDILHNTNKVVLDQKSGNGLIYLPLDKLMQATGAAAAAGSPAPAAAATAPSADSVPAAASADVLPGASRSRDALRSRDREERQ